MLCSLHIIDVFVTERVEESTCTVRPALNSAQNSTITSRSIAALLRPLHIQGQVSIPPRPARPSGPNPFVPPQAGPSNVASNRQGSSAGVGSLLPSTIHCWHLRGGESSGVGFGPGRAMPVAKDMTLGDAWLYQARILCATSNECQ